jgi:hypothetical protein
MSAELNLVRQQGFPEAPLATCSLQYRSLMWQPRAIGVLVLVGLVWQDAGYFLALSGILWWNVLLPRFNVFDALHNRYLARPRGLPLLSPAPGPRRFAQALAGTFLLAIGLSLLAGRGPLSIVLQAVLLLALATLVFGRFCVGSYLYLLATGREGFATKTLPWARGEEFDSTAGQPPAPRGSR